tara:strand:+ start:3265 stop:3573 length:309 start_codon:yes stop_codon:yes gene_type:complete
MQGTLGHSNTGHILPCCWVDNDRLKRHELGSRLLHPDLSIDNNETIEDILLSDAWVEWDDMLRNEPEKAPHFCWDYCKGKTVAEELEEIKDNISDIPKPFKC